MKQTDPQIKIRLPGGMRGQIKDLADKNGRSMNSEIVARLAETLTGERSAADGVAQTLAQIQRDLANLVAHIKSNTEG